MCPVAVGLLPVRLDGAKHLGPQAVGKDVAAKLGAKHGGDFCGCRDNPASGLVEGDVDLRDVDWARPELFRRREPEAVVRVAAISEGRSFAVEVEQNDAN
jgi:hypothetical protein